MAGLPAFNIKQGLISSAGVENTKTRDLSPSKPLKMAIIPINEAFNPLLTTLILNPESIQETKSANWVRHNIPGQSDPLLQWISGSERTVTFMAKVTLDVAENFTVNQGSMSDIWTLEIDPELSRIKEITGVYNANILNKLSDVSLRSLTSGINQTEAASNTATRWRVSIQPQLDFYRSLLMPRKPSRKNNQNRTPPLVSLHMGDILGDAKFSKNQKYVLASYSINILQTTPEMLPTQADVVFTFIEYNDKGKVFDVPPEAGKSYISLRNSGIITEPKPVKSLPTVIDGSTSGRGVA